MDNFVYYLVYVFTRLVSWLPFWLLYRISDVMFLICFYVVRYRRDTVFSNLGLAFPEKDEKEIRKLAMGFYRHFCDLLLESVKSLSMSPATFDRRFRFLNPGLLHELARENKSIALVSGHYGNWEWIVNLPQHTDHVPMAIYRPLQNRLIDRLVRHIRSRLGLIVVPMENIYRRAFQYRNNNQLFLAWFVADQRPPRSNTFWTVFLNQETSFFQGLEKMARKMDLAVVFLDIAKKKRGFYEASFKKLFDNAPDTVENQITLAYVKELENEIRRQPEYWLWSHRRFRNTRPENIKLITA